ncbi:uncharacterized protein [Onthophagus taurus]|uniref:uncharacterized protein n=1 Tax=Onthophagus taurus TaxID=166361 RepID=UPI000C202041|nr:uncharacterized protein LOC111423575 [Onthophagus taurus]XP_022912603.1 uncharacterized protein LOC111423575 [Onthophagus taurus]
MKSPPSVTDDCDDIFGPPRTYETGYCPPKNRPSMISAKYRQKEERRKVLKISINKLKKIEDPEASLCRSVLINNTMKRLQKEARDEKIQKQQLNYPRCYENDNFLNLKSEFMKNELKTFDQPGDFTPNDAKIVDSLSADFAMEPEFDRKIGEVMNEGVEVIKNLMENEFCVNGSDSNSNNNVCVVQETQENSTTNNTTTNPNNRFSRKRSFDDYEDCDVQDVLSQFYMPPTPRMLTCIDEDEDVNVVDVEEPSTKRAKIEIISETTSCNSNSEVIPRLDEFLQKFDKDDYRMMTYTNNNLPPDTDRLRYVPSSTTVDDTNSYSCGHASMFNDIQNNVFHSLITSLET